jgi:hypothetical protein
VPKLTITRFRDLIRTLNYVVSVHAAEELDDDNLTILDLENIITTMPEATLGERWRRPKLCLLASYGSEPQRQRALLRDMDYGKYAGLLVSDVRGQLQRFLGLGKYDPLPCVERGGGGAEGVEHDGGVHPMRVRTPGQK